MMTSKKAGLRFVVLLLVVLMVNTLVLAETKDACLNVAYLPPACDPANSTMAGQTNFNTDGAPYTQTFYASSADVIAAKLRVWGFTSCVPLAVLEDSLIDQYYVEEYFTYDNPYPTFGVY